MPGIRYEYGGQSRGVRVTRGARKMSERCQELGVYVRPRGRSDMLLMREAAS